MSARSFHEGRVSLHTGDCRAVLDTLAENSVDSCVKNRALEIGKAAEHLVVADLLLAGHRAFLTDQGLPYDVVFDNRGRLLRVQVKSSMKSRPVPGRPGSALSYMFHVRRAGKGAKRLIGNDEFDLLALVALDIRVIAYLPITSAVLQTIHLREPGCASTHPNRKRENIDQFPVEKALEGLLS